MRRWVRRFAGVTAVAAALCAASCKRANKPDPIDCDAELGDKERDSIALIVPRKLGNPAPSDVTAAEQMDKAAAELEAEIKKQCSAHNDGAITREKYREAVKPLRERLGELDDLVGQLRAAADPLSAQLALRLIYGLVVPEPERVGFELDFGILALSPGQTEWKALTPGATVPSGTALVFAIKPSRAAYLYIVSASPKGSRVLFPTADAPVLNPVRADQEVRVPKQPIVLAGDSVGSHRVEVVASMRAVPMLQTAVDRGGASAAEFRCAARGLKVDSQNLAPCDAVRGIEYQPRDPALFSLYAETTPADSTIVRTFSFAQR